MASDAIKCPKCAKDTPVPEGDDGIYLDEGEYESTCDHCGAEFCVRAVVTIEWGEPRLYQNSEETR